MNTRKRNANKGNDLLSIASHELKTPLTALKLQVEMVKREMENHPESVIPPHKMKNIINRTHQDVLRLSRLVDDMLDCSRMSVGRFNINLEYFNLQEFVEELIGRHPIAQENFFYYSSNAPLLVYWDKFRMEQVILNLLTNAIRYGDRSRIDLHVKSGGGYAYIEVKDQGPGIPKNIQKRIFEKYGRGAHHNNTCGLGLGLYIVHEIVKLHQGHIKVESAPGKGTCFQIQLPITASDDYYSTSL